MALLKKASHIVALIILVAFIYPVSSVAQQDSLWADSVLSKLTLNEKLGQLLMVRANQPEKKYDRKIENYIRDYNIGGVTFFAGDLLEQAETTNEWQEMSKVPLLVSIDGEWGLGMRMKEALPFPYQMTLGAIEDDTLIYRMGQMVGEQCQRMGIHMNFAPVVDINSNPANPIIHMRSFGENKENVSVKGTQYMKGMQDAGILTVAKHFPGHGDTDTDSHKTLPIIHKDRAQLDSLELYPFKKLINKGVDGVMIAHLYIPELEKEENLASTLSKNIVTGLLKEELGFQGLIITDALDMKGVTSYHEPGEIEVLAFLAGNDILLLPEDIPAAMKGLIKAVEDGRITEEMVDERCRKVLLAKFKAGLASPGLIVTEGLPGNINTPQVRKLNMILAEKAVTLVQNNGAFLPLERLDTLEIAVISNLKERSVFQGSVSLYEETDNFFLPGDPGNRDRAKMLQELEPYNLVIASLHSSSPWNTETYGISESFMEFISELSSQKKVILDVFGSPYILRKIKDPMKFAGIVISYQNMNVIQDVSAQMIFGGLPFEGSLPVSGSDLFPAGTGIKTSKTRLQFAGHERLGIPAEFIRRADSIIEEGLDVKAFPGCQVIAAKDGIVFYNRTAGYHTYDKKKKVKMNDIYDVASLTKVAATALAIMDLNEQGRFDIDMPLSYYLPYLKNTNKENIIIRESLAHQSRFQNWIPYFQYTIEKGKPDPSIYNPEITEDFPVRVAEDLYISKNYSFTVIDSIINSPLRKSDTYLYSDLGYYLIKDAIEQVLNEPYDLWLEKRFYKPLGLSNTNYLPRKHWGLDRIVPTEYDKQFRKQLVHGDVHDQGAAMLGGVSGHAGLFSNALDLVVVMQMLLDGGEYGGTRYLQPGTIKEFTKMQFPLNGNRRGISFDKPLIEFEEDGPNCRSASPSSFGHSGFTGTYMWADPENGLVYVFLSNRVHPDAWNNKISKLNIRTNLHQVFYDAIEKSKNFVDF